MDVRATPNRAVLEKGEGGEIEWVVGELARVGWDGKGGGGKMRMEGGVGVV